MFNVEEITLMNNHKTKGRQELIDTFKKMIPFFTAEEEDMKEMVDSVIRKLTAISDQQFEQIDFSLAMDID